MELSPELIAGAILALTGLLSSISGIVSKKSSDQRAEVEALRVECRELRDQLVENDRQMFALKRVLAQHGIDVPELEGVTATEK